MEYLRKKMELCLIMSIFAFMMIFLIELNQLIKIEISCGSLYHMNLMKMNLRVKQLIYTMTRYRIRRGLLPNIQPSILFRERGKNVDYRNKTFDDFGLMIVDPPPTLNSEESYILSSCFGTFIENESNEVMSKTVLTRLLKC